MASTKRTTSSRRPAASPTRRSADGAAGHPAPESGGRAYGGVPADERVAARRRRLLDAGLELFGTTGYHATTVRALCAEAGLTARYFYESFPSTEALLIAVYRHWTDHLHDRLATAIAEAAPTDPTDRGADEAVVRHALDAVFASIEDPRVLRVCWLEVLGVSPAVDETYITGIGRFDDLVAGVLAARAPHVDPDRLHLLAVALVGAVIQTAVRWLLDGQHQPREVLVDVTTRLFLGAADRLDAP